MAMIIMMLVLLFLGAFMDQVSMLLLTLPFFMPLAVAQGIDMIWLMVLMLIVMEISLLTPPFGLLLYVMKGVAPFRVSLGAVVRSALPFIAIELVVLALLIFVPEVATWLPKQID
jgi:TRAP-type C4-dicarboxylate transport system permease large subunit